MEEKERCEIIIGREGEENTRSHVNLSLLFTLTGLTNGLGGRRRTAGEEEQAKESEDDGRRHPPGEGGSDIHDAADVHEADDVYDAADTGGPRRRIIEDGRPNGGLADSPARRWRQEAKNGGDDEDGILRHKKNQIDGGHR